MIVSPMSCQPCLWTEVHVFPVLLFLVFHVNLVAFIPANGSKITPIKKKRSIKNILIFSLSLLNSTLCPHSDPHSEASVLYCNQQCSPSHTKAHSGHVGPGPPCPNSPSLWKWSWRQWHHAAGESSINTRATRVQHDRAAVWRCHGCQTAEPLHSKDTNHVSNVSLAVVSGFTEASEDKDP